MVNGWMQCEVKAIQIYCTLQFMLSDFSLIVFVVKTKIVCVARDWNSTYSGSKLFYSHVTGNFSTALFGAYSVLVTALQSVRLIFIAATCACSGRWMGGWMMLVYDALLNDVLSSPPADAVMACFMYGAARRAYSVPSTQHTSGARYMLGDKTGKPKLSVRKMPITKLLSCCSVANEARVILSLNRTVLHYCLNFTAWGQGSAAIM